jgi:HAD superfamily hydrolase (TIGR01509 family)
MISALIFDCFGVLASDGWLPFKDQYFGHDPERYAEATRLNRKSDGGLATYDDFIRAIARLAGLDEGQTRLAIERNVPDTVLLRYIETELKPTYKVGVLSNASANWLPRIFTPPQLALFDAVALSWEMGWAKPAAPAYQEIARRLGTPVSDCLFIDDHPGHCAGARAAGMTAVRYAGLDQLRAALPALLA